LSQLKGIKDAYASYDVTQQQIVTAFLSKEWPAKIVRTLTWVNWQLSDVPTFVSRRRMEDTKSTELESRRTITIFNVMTILAGSGQ
jgi:hypothetical protein